ncbi:hypothetical protein MMC22_002381 [Lobaria immixta]|nr:hypothetical protein [Lobaria immixta]
MGDPISAAASAVGIISLGLQVCQGLISYCESWKSRDADVAHAYDKINGLRNILERLELVVPRLDFSNGKIVQDVNSSIVSCTNGIEKLREMLGKCDSYASQGFILKHAQKALYPFKKEILQSLKATVTDLQDNLSSSLHVIEIDVLGSQAHALSSLSSISKATEAGVRGLESSLKSLNGKIEAVHPAIPIMQQQTNTIVPNTQGLDSALENIQHDLHNNHQDLASHLSKLEAQMEKLSTRVETAIVQGLNEYGRSLFEAMQSSHPATSPRWADVGELDLAIKSFQMDLIQRPDLLRSVCDEAVRVEPNLRHVIQGSEQVLCSSNFSKFRRQLRTPRCSCRPSTAFKALSAPRLRGSTRSLNAWFSLSSFKHRQDCPLYATSERRHSIGINLSYCGLILAKAAQASISITRGAGGFSISPTLTFSPVVPSSSAVFSVFDFGHWDSVTDTQQRLKAFVKKLRQLFQDGKASPFDVDEDGNSLLHKACIGLYTLLCLDLENVNVDFDFYFQFIQELHGLGAPINTVNYSGLTCLSTLMPCYAVARQKQLTDLSLRMLDMGAEYRGIPPIFLAEILPHLNQELAKIMDFADALDCNEISKAVLLRSEVQLRQAIRALPHLINSANKFGQTPLHLSVDWPRGMKILLNADADIDMPDDSGRLPIHYATHQESLETLSLLGEADCALYTFSDHHQSGVGVLKYAIDNEFHDTWQNLSPFPQNLAATTDFVIALEANRRRRLQRLASNFLPTDILQAFGFSQNKVFDEDAVLAVAALRKRGIAVPSPLLLPDLKTTVYHIPHLTVRILDSLWNAGFRDIDAYDEDGLTPLMIVSFLHCELHDGLERVAWMQAKGADIHRVQKRLDQLAEAGSTCEVYLTNRKSNRTALHHIGLTVGEKLQQLLSWSPKNDARPDFVFLASSLSELLNTHLNVYSLMGPEMVAHGLVEHNMLSLLWGTDGPAVDPERLSWSRLMFITDLLTKILESGNPAWRWLSSKILRFWTFERLGLTHTCCHRDIVGFHTILRPFGNDADISEIHEEEHEILGRLEDLLSEFEEKRLESGDSLTDFLKGYWRDRIDEVLTETTFMDEEKLREIGVVLHTKVEDTEKNSAFGSTELPLLCCS